MAIKSFEIDWNGAQESIEYEDDLTYGELDAILQNCIDLSDLNKPKVDIPKYRFQILLKVIKKAPFAVGDSVALRNLKSKQANEIMKGVMADFPLAKYLGDWVETFTGSANQIGTSSHSTTSAQ